MSSTRRRVAVLLRDFHGGGAERSMEMAAQVAERSKPDFIDINCGCWVKNVAMRGEGAGLLRDLPHFERVVKSTVGWI